MVAPGILEARYQRLAGDELKRRELFIARRELGFTIDEWRALPWWQRRVYVEGMNDEADARAEAQGRPPGAAVPTPSGIVDAIYNGTAGDVAALGLATG